MKQTLALQTFSKPCNLFLATQTFLIPLALPSVKCKAYKNIIIDQLGNTKMSQVT